MSSNALTTLAVTAPAVALGTYLWLLRQKREEQKVGTVTEVVVYPVKSAAGISVEASALDARGLRFDRLWMVVDSRGAFVSQRRAPRLALVKPKLPTSDESPLELSAPGVADLAVPVVEKAAKAVTVRCWEHRIAAVDQGDAAAKWFQDFLKLPGARLVRMPSTTRRLCNPKYAPRGTHTGFADGYPVLLASNASLADLNTRIANETIPMNRFRPNVVVDAEDAWAEDRWIHVRIGENVFLVAKPCSRCKMPTIDQATGIPGGERDAKVRDDDLGGGPNAGIEPTATLQTFRTGAHLGYADPSWASEVFFGQNLCRLPGFLDVLRRPAPVRLGDPVFLLK